MKFNKDFLFIAGIIALSYFAIAPFFQHGFFSMHDDTQVARVAQMSQSLRDGMFPVRWVKDLGYGFGYPIFNFYSPFPYYFGGIIALFSNALFATKITFIVAVVGSGIAMYFLTKSFFDRVSAFVAGLIYIYFPYHAVNVYVRGNLNEVVAYAVLPLVLLGILKLWNTKDKQKRNLWTLFTALSIALVIISHNLTSLMLGFILAFVFVFTLFTAKHKKEFFMAFIGSGVLALLFSAFYWLPVIFEMKYTNVLSQVGGTADFRDHYVCPSQLWNSIWGYGGSGAGCLDGMSFKLGKVHILLSVLSLFVLVYAMVTKKRINPIIIPILFFVLFILSVFMTVSLSASIWEIIPGLEFLQFPWRFLNFVGVSMSVVIAFLVFYATQFIMRFVQPIIAVGIIGATIFLNGKLFIPQTYYSDRDNAYYTKWENIAYNASSLTDEYLPPKFTSKPKSESDLVRKRVVGDGVVVRELQYTTDHLSANLQTSVPTNVLVYIAYFPTWKAYIDGNEVAYRVVNNFISIPVPAGTHTLELVFVQTPVEKFANGVTVLTAFGVGSFLISENRKRKHEK